MQYRQNVCATASSYPRRGLAPVELVLALPVWMLLASAMVLMGNLAVWKIRGHGVAREAAARTLWPRTRDGEAVPTEWNRRSGLMSIHPASPAVVNDPLAQHAVIRGPVISVPAAGSIGVDSSFMPSSGTISAGEASLNEPPVLWPKSGVRNTFHRQFPIDSGLTGQWPGPANALRSPRIWSLPPIQ